MCAISSSRAPPRKSFFSRAYGCIAVLRLLDALVLASTRCLKKFVIKAKLNLQASIENILQAIHKYYRINPVHPQLMRIVREVTLDQATANNGDSHLAFAKVLGRWDLFRKSEINPVSGILYNSPDSITLYVLVFIVNAYNRGAVAQLGERCVRNAEAEGSIPFGSTRFLIEINHFFI